MRGGALAATERVICLAAPGSDDAVDRLVDAVGASDASLVLREVGDTVRPEDVVPGATLGLTVGGDGTFLSGVHAFAPRSIPFFGVNTGTLGFLARTQPDDLAAALADVFEGVAELSPRRRFRVTGPGFEATGINEVTVERPMPDDPVGRKVCRLDVAVDREYLGVYEGTGLAVAAPTGSTAMALSAGGAVQEHGENGTLQIVGLHTNRLGHQPVVLDADQTVTVETTSRVRVTVDGGRPREQVEGGSVLRVAGDPDPALVVETRYDRPFFDALGERLGWGGHDAREPPTEQPPRPAPPSGVSDSAGDAVCAAGDAVRATAAGVETVDGTALTAARTRAERVLTNRLAREFPGDTVEVGTSTTRAGDRARTWLAAPLDGADNLACGAPAYAVALSLVEDAERPSPVTAAVFLPAFAELVVADEPGSVVRVDTADTPEWQERIDGADGTVPTVVGPTDRTALADCRVLVEGPPVGVERAVGSVRRPGSQVVAVTQVATGRADACWLSSAGPAVRPALALLELAGGRCTTPAGDPVSLRAAGTAEQKLVVSNGSVHERLQEQGRG